MPVKRDIYGPEVVELWRHDVDSPRAGPLAESRVSGDAEEALDRFNAYIRGPLQAAVVESIGHEAHVPYYLCVVAFLPMNFYSLVNTLGCDSGPCETSARNAGFDSVESYLGTQALAWLLCLLLTFPLTHPVLLRQGALFGPLLSETKGCAFVLRVPFSPWLQEKTKGHRICVASPFDRAILGPRSYAHSLPKEPSHTTLFSQGVSGWRCPARKVTI